MAGDAGRLPFPGTALHFEGAFWEVVQYQPPPTATGAHRYFLNPWDDRFPLRAPLEYSPAIGASQERAARHDEQRLRQARALGLIAPLVALLPARDQRHLERELGFSAAAATSLSAALLGAAAGAFLLVAFWAVRDPAAPGLLVRLAAFSPLAVYLLLESLVRLYSGMAAGEPLGSALVALPFGLLRTLSSLSAGSGAAGEGKRSMSAQQLAQLKDRVLALPAASGRAARLEVRSLLPKPHWTLQRSGIHYRGRWYRLLERHQAAGEPLPYRFVLEQAEPASFFSTHCEYRPEELGALLVEQRRRERSTWVETFAPVWGLLEGGDKRRLAARYDFDAEGATRTSILGVGALSALLLLVAVGTVLRGEGRLLRELVALSIGGFLVYESVVRWRVFERGELPGSALGRLLRPLARPLLEIPERAQPRAPGNGAQPGSDPSGTDGSVLR